MTNSILNCERVWCLFHQKEPSVKNKNLVKNNLQHTFFSILSTSRSLTSDIPQAVRRGLPRFPSQRRGLEEWYAAAATVCWWSTVPLRLPSTTPNTTVKHLPLEAECEVSPLNISYFDPSWRVASPFHKTLMNKILFYISSLTHGKVENNASCLGEHYPRSSKNPQITFASLLKWPSIHRTKEILQYWVSRGMWIKYANSTTSQRNLSPV